MYSTIKKRKKEILNRFGGDIKIIRAQGSFQDNARRLNKICLDCRVEEFYSSFSLQKELACNLSAAPFLRVQTKYSGQLRVEAV